MDEKQSDARHYCPYFRGVDEACALLQAMNKTDTRCKVFRGSDSVRCRYLDSQVCKRG